MNTNLTQILNITHRADINNGIDFCKIYKHQKPIWMRRSLVILFMTILFKAIVIILTIIKHIVSSSYKGSWGTSVVIIFTLSLAIKFFNLCIIKFGRKQIYTFYNYTKKSTCVDGCLEYFDDGLPFFKLGNSYFIEILSIFLLIFSLSLFLLYLYRKEIHSRRGIQTVQDTLTINDITRPPSNGEFLIQNNNDYLNQG